MVHAVNLTAGKKEGLTFQNLRQFVSDGFNKFFVSHIPVESIQEMPKYYMYVFGLVAYLISFFLFFVFIYKSYTSAVEQPFMSLQPGPLCDEVYINVTQDLMADSYGHWFGQTGFQYPYYVYNVELNLFSGTYQDFADAIEYVQVEVNKLGELSRTQNLALNIIYWMNYLLEVPAADSIVLFSFSGIPNQVYNLKYFHGQVSYVAADCPLTSLSSYDMANSLLESEYNYSQFATEISCYGAVNPYSLGFIKSIDGALLKFSLDVQSFQLALGVNMGVVPVSQLLVVPSSTINLYVNTSTNLVSMTLAAYFSSRTPFMAPIYCASNITGVAGSIEPGSVLHQLTSSGAVCLVNVGDIYGLPVFNSWGASTTEPEYCDCSLESGTKYNCENFDFISGILFYNSPVSKQISSFTNFEELLGIELAGLVGLLNKTQSYLQLNRDSYNASWASSYSVDDEASNNKEANPLFKSLEWRKTAYEFCNIPDPFLNVTGKVSNVPLTQTCSLITFNTFDPITRGISEYKYQLVNGSCQNTFTVPNATWSLLANNPPVQFTQDYYACTDGLETAMLNAIGIAQGNVQVVLPLMVFASLPFLFMFLSLIGQVPPRAEYDDMEKDSVIDSWATQLLRIRDGKTRGLRAKGILIGLGKELIRAAKEEGGYPDSDDSDDEDDRSSITSKRQSEQQRGRIESKASSTTERSDRKSKAKKPIVFHRHQFDVFTRNIREQEKANKAAASPAPSAGAATPRSSISYGLYRRSEGSKQGITALSQAYGLWTKTNKGAASPSSTAQLGLGGTTINTGLLPRTISGMSVMSNDSGRTAPKDLSMVIMGSRDADVRVLNSRDMNPDVDLSREPRTELGGMEVEAVVEMLMTKLQEAVSKRPNDFRPARETEAYGEAKLCALRIARANVDSLLAREDAGEQIFLQLSNALTLHASIALGCEVRDVSLHYIDSIGYEIGGRVYTPKHFMELCTASH